MAVPLRQWRDLAICVLLVAVTSAVYSQARGFAFLNFDDDEYVSENPLVRAGLTAGGVRWALTSVHAATWHPLTSLSHMLDCQLFGLDAGAHHLVSVAIHAASAALLFLALGRMTAATWPSALAAALFALHPLHVESVAWVSERKDVLSTLFLALTLLAYAGYARRPTLRRYAQVAAPFVLGLAAKPMLVTLPGVLLLLDFWPLARVSWPRRAAAGAGPAGAVLRPIVPPVAPVRALLEKLPLLVLALAVAAVTFVVQRRAGAMQPTEALPLDVRAANALVACVAYLRMALWPAGLAVFYPYRLPLPPAEVAASAAVLLAVSAACVATARRRPYLLVGWLWYLGTLVPVIGLVPVGEQSMADRYTYVPLIGPFVAVAWGAADFAAKSRTRRVAVSAVALGALALLGQATWSQAHHWRDTESLFRHALAVTADNYLAHTNLGAELLRQGRAVEAADEFAAALRIKPDFARGHLGMGLARARLGDPRGAVAHLTRAVWLDPGNELARYQLGAAFEALGEIDVAIAHYSRALELRPDDARAHNDLGLALAAQRRFSEAAAHYREALRVAPKLAAAHNNLAIALEQLGNVDQAIAHYREVARLLADDPRPRLNLAALLIERDRAAEAVALLREAESRWPGNPEVERALARALAASAGAS